MSLNIKNAETHRLVQELVALTGETQTTAVTIAVRERLDRVRHLHEVGLADRLLAIGADTAPRVREPFRTTARADISDAGHQPTKAAATSSARQVCKILD